MSKNKTELDIQQSYLMLDLLPNLNHIRSLNVSVLYLTFIVKVVAAILLGFILIDSFCNLQDSCSINDDHVIPRLSVMNPGYSDEPWI